MPSLEVPPGKSRLMLIAGAVAVLVALALVAIFAVRAALDDDAPEVDADPDGYAALACTLAADLAERSPDTLADGADGPVTADAHTVAALLAAAGARDRELLGLAALGARLGLHATRQQSGGIAAQLRALGGRCGDRASSGTTDQQRAAYACAIGARLRAKAGDVADLGHETAAGRAELRAMALLTSRVDEAPYDDTAEPAERAFLAAAQPDEEEYDAALDDLEDACADAGL